MAIVQFPGVNCETETGRALHRVGLEPEVFAWTRPPSELRDYRAFVIPGGFSYQDRVRAGALAAKDPLMEVIGEEAEAGKPVLGICNGAQVLVEAGLVPGPRTVELALARNRMEGRAGYYARWVLLRVEASPCVFTSTLAAGDLLPMPVAHGEGRFAARNPKRLAALAAQGQAPLRYAAEGGGIANEFPDNPNGSPLGIAAMCNARGNVMALMPHPERAQDLGALKRGIGGPWEDRRHAWAGGSSPDVNAEGPGLAIFRGLARHLEGS
ncbi:MAG: phosphoribosylformylglycinamidine synthase I [Candidatus Eisenbacteria bacterium]